MNQGIKEWNIYRDALIINTRVYRITHQWQAKNVIQTNSKKHVKGENVDEQFMRDYLLKNISQAKWIIHRPSDKSSWCHFMTDKLSSQREAVLRNVLGTYKPIITPIGMSDGAFTLLFTLPSPTCLSLAMSCPADGVGTMGLGGGPELAMMMMATVMCNWEGAGFCIRGIKERFPCLTWVTLARKDLDGRRRREGMRSPGGVARVWRTTPGLKGD